MLRKLVDVSYDDIADVLYVSVADQRPNRYEEDAAGLVWRLDARGDAYGVAIFDFLRVWNEPHRSLTEEIAKRLSVKTGEISNALDAAVQ